MAFGEQGIVGSRVAKVGGILAMLGLMFVAHQFVTGGPLFREADISEQIDDMADGGQPMSPLYAALREEFPADYERFKAHVESVALNGGNQAEVLAAGHRWMQRFTLSLAKDFARAPRAALFKVRDDHEAVVEALAKSSTRMCAEFGMTGLQPGARPTDEIARLLAKAGADQIRAAAAGRKAPVARTEPTEADGREFAEQLEAAGLSQFHIAAIFGGTMQRFSVQSQCKASQALYKSLGAVSDGASERLSAVILVPQEPV
jgi:hypothetical protein